MKSVIKNKEQRLFPYSLVRFMLDLLMGGGQNNDILLLSLELS